ncbi:MAG TPA: FAD-dependent oxidoreductase [Anaerolineales bacterium]|nr:FAD-dependent oxidoreductase [Anaerolineales bacterium]
MEHRFDVVIYGGTAGGVIAAIAAAKEGVRVALVEPGRHVGGMVSGGLSHTDYGDTAVIGGLALEFYERVARHYGAENWSLRGPEPHLAERIFRECLQQAGVDVFFNARLDHVEKQGQRIYKMTTDRLESFAANVFIDASYEGDLLARARVSYGIGRESVEQYGESWAGRQPIRPDKHNFSVAVSPFVNGKDGVLLPLIHERPMVREGEADHGVQAYCFRLCLTDRPENRLPFPKPVNYDPNQFELLKRFLLKAGPQFVAGKLMSLSGRLPNDKIDVNSIGPISTNLLDGSSWKYPDADYSQRQAIWDRHFHYTQGLLYFLANDPSVPDPIRTEMNRWGLCKDEFVDTDHWPHQLYIREARRMRGEYIMTQADLEDQRAKYDSIGVGSYNIDIREVQRVWIWVPHFPNLVGETFNEGYLSVPVNSYEIPYRSLVPKYHECDNLLVSVCVSASHVAYSSIRMEPQYMILGHAAGVAAALAVQNDVAVQRVNIVELQSKLLAQRQVIARK